MIANKNLPRKLVANKDSSEVVEFMILFNRLKDWSDDDPGALHELPSKDESVIGLCSALVKVVRRLQFNSDRELFTAPVDPKFIASWRDFERRFEPVLRNNYLFAWGECDWESADFNAEISAALIDQTIELASSRADGDKSDIGFESYTIEEGVWWAAEEWARLTRHTGFDLRGVFRRRRLIPFVFFPRHVAARGENLSIYESLRQAHEAFIYGAPFAALALMRSIMEVVLREHYGAKGNDLSESISNSRKLLPKGATVASLHRLRKLANAILHLDLGNEAALPKLEPAEMEMEILSLLRMLRSLIEGAPQRLLVPTQNGLRT
jgi:Domain of unknown function (DUF4145)